MGNVGYAILIAAGLVGLTAWLYKANHDTPVPAGCENLKPDCVGCGLTSCSLRRQEPKGEKENG